MELEKIDQSVRERTWVGIEGLEPSRSIKPTDFPPTIYSKKKEFNFPSRVDKFIIGLLNVKSVLQLESGIYLMNKMLGTIQVLIASFV